jgi:hypothetical protein
MSTANFAILDYCSLISLNLTLAPNVVRGWGEGDTYRVAVAATRSRTNSTTASLMYVGGEIWK